MCLNVLGIGSQSSFYRDFVRHHCWLINTTGKPDSFSPVDKAQELNIKDIKVTYRSQGPNIDWAYLKKLHPAIHVIRALTLHIEEEFGTLTRGKSHTNPEREKDVERLQKSYTKSTFHRTKGGRKINSKADTYTDYATKGCTKLLQGKILKKWVQLRTFERATTESWGEILDDDEDEESAGEGSSRADVNES